MKKIIILLLTTYYLLLTPYYSYAVKVRIKDITRLEGVAENQLIGYGLVVGLNRTGDSTGVLSTVQSIVNMLKNFGINVKIGDMRTRNIAAVMVTCKLPPFAKVGDRVDAIVSSIGDATSLEGGTLLLTPLQGQDNKIYATCQGPVSIGGKGVALHKVVGRVIEGALIVKEIENKISSGKVLTFVLTEADFTTALSIQEVINKSFLSKLAKAEDASKVVVKIPSEYMDNLVGFIAKIENLRVTQLPKAVVVINERTGTIVMGGEVKLQTCAISHGKLSIVIKEEVEVKIGDGREKNVPEMMALAPPSPRGIPPLPHPRIRTEVRKEVIVKEKERRVMEVKAAPTISDVVKVLNALGVTPQDLIAIMQALKEAGALQAELRIM